MNRSRRPVQCLAFCLVVFTATWCLAAGPKKSTFFKLQELSPEVTLEGSTFFVPTNFGPTGLKGWILENYLVVREVEAGSPADGILLPNDVIFSAGGLPLGENPLRTFGRQIAPAEADGKLKLGIIRGGKKQHVVLPIAALGKLGADWPRDCGKSMKILDGACRYIDSIQEADGTFYNNTHVGLGLAGLTLLGSDDPAADENLRRMLYEYVRSGRSRGDGNPCWGWGYMATLFSEYYLRTGDPHVLPTMQEIANQLADSQGAAGTWGHGKNFGPGYVQGGYLNAAGAGCWLGLIMLDKCGITAPNDALARATRFFDRFSDRGGVPYGNHRPEFFLTGNSKDSLSGLAQAARGNARGGEVVGRMVTDGYRDRVKGHTGGFLGFSMGNMAGLNNPHRPDYRRMLDHWGWLFDISRRWDGGFMPPGSVTGNIYLYRGPLMATGGMALAYTEPNRNMQITGAPKSIFAEKNLSPRLKEAVKLYHDKEFDKLRKTLKPESDYAKQLLAAAQRREKDIELSLAKARKALADGDPWKCYWITKNLDVLCRGKLSMAKELMEKSQGDEYASMRGAGKYFEANRYLVDTNPGARKILQKIAECPTSGIYGKKSAKALARPADSSDWIFLCEKLLGLYSSGRDREPARSGYLRLATVKGGNWPQWKANAALREEGVINTDYTKSWTPLVAKTFWPDGDGPEVKWHYLARNATSPEVPADWTKVDFDDSSWAKGPGPVRSERGNPLAIPRGTIENYVRIPFETKKTDFKEWNLYLEPGTKHGKAAVFLNGKPLAWAEGGGKFLTLDLAAVPSKMLHKGKNVLAVRFAARGSFDIGLYAK